MSLHFTLSQLGSCASCSTAATDKFLEECTVSLLAIITREGLGGSPVVALWRLIDWQAIAVEIELLRQHLDVRRGGPTPWDPVSMFAATILQDWHGLSFGELSRALRVRLDFQFFAGFEPGLRVPSASSLCRARRRATREDGTDEHGSSVAASLNADVIDQESSP